jgi:hypothetical protein
MVSPTSGYHSQSNGQVERMTQELGRFLRGHCQDRQGERARFFPWAEYAQNSLRHSTELTPFQCVLGYQPALALRNPSQTNAPAVDEWFRRAEEVWNDAHLRLQCTIRRQKEQVDRHRSEAPMFHPGDHIWLSTRNLPLRLPCKKLSPRFVGLFKVLRRVNEVDYNSPLTIRSHHLFMFPFSGRWFPVPWLMPSPNIPAPPLNTLRGAPPMPSDHSWMSCESAPVPGGLGGVWSRGVVLGSGVRHSRSQHHPRIPPSPSGPLLDGFVLQLELRVGGGGNSSLCTPGNPHYAHLRPFMRHTWNPSLP